MAISDHIQPYKVIYGHLREFVVTTVILAPGAYWVGSNSTILAQNRCKTGQNRPEPARTGNNRACSQKNDTISREGLQK